MLTAHRAALLADFPAAYPIIDFDHLRARGPEPTAMARNLARSGMRIAQCRFKGDVTRRVFEAVAAVVAELRRGGVCCIVNDRADIALVTGADGVHVGQEDIAPREIRRLVGPEMIVGHSTHSVTQVSDGECASADYLAIGPVFATASKREPDPVVGLAGVSRARRATAKPLVAIGGITLANCRDVLDAGADSVAVISGVTAENVTGWTALRR